MLRWAIIAVSVAFAVSAAALGWLNRNTPIPESMSLGSTAITVAAPIAALVIVAVGQLVASRYPRHLVAWSFLLFGLTGEATLLVQAYGLYGMVTAPDALPAAGTVLWVATWSWPMPEVPLAFSLLLFPDGRPIGPRWWGVAWAVAVGCALQMASDLLRVQPDLAALGLERPLPTLPLDTLDAISSGGAIIWAVATLAAAASLVMRLRRATGDERQQLKWVAYAGMVATVTFILSSVLYGMPQVGTLFAGLAAVGVILIPVSAAIAILRYRLYDIDVVIERTLVYGGLSATVAGTYWILVILLQAALRPITGGSEIAVAASTLAVLALAQPLRRRIQHAVDRRFYRDRYDGARALDAFTVRLRDGVALDSVRRDLLDAVGQTVQPTTASLWLRERA